MTAPDVPTVRSSASPTLTRRTGRLVLSAVFSCIGLAGASKFVDAGAFSVRLESLYGVPVFAAAMLALLIPAAEVVLFGLWFARIGRGACVVGLVGLLMGFVVFWIIVTARQLPADCGCIGILEQFFRTKKTAVEGLLVSVSLLAIAVVAGLVAFPHFRNGRRAPALSTGAASRGYTLLETLLSISITAILLALLFPSLGAFRDSARTAKSLSNIRSHASIISIYTIDWRDTYPYFTYPQATRTVLRAEQAGVVVEVPYFWAFQYWNVALADSYYDGQPFHDSFYPPTYPDGLGTREWRFGPTPYHYACSFLARPEFWNPARRTYQKDQLGPNSAQDVVFPAAKALLTASYPVAPLPGNIVGFEMSNPLAIGFVDGSAANVPANRCTPGYPNGDGSFNFPMHQNTWPPGLHTIDGARGRDLR